MREIEDIEQKKKALILDLMQYQFEERMTKLINSRAWSSMDELDQIVDEKLRKYYEECDAVVAYYDRKTYS